MPPVRVAQAGVPISDAAVKAIPQSGHLPFEFSRVENIVAVQVLDELAGRGNLPPCFAGSPDAAVRLVQDAYFVRIGIGQGIRGLCGVVGRAIVDNDDFLIGL